MYAHYTRNTVTASIGLVSSKFDVRSEHMLRTYQCRAANTIVTNAMCAGFIDMGLGKTVIGLTAIVDIKRLVEVERCNPTFAFKWLVIAPIKVCETVWRQEAKLWDHTPHLKFSLIRGDLRDRAFALHKEADVYLINPELVPWLKEYLRSDWSKFKGLIVDESSLFKNHRSKRFTELTNYGSQTALKGADGKALRGADGKTIKIPPHRFVRTVIFTGTPRPQSAMNLWSQIYILDHGERLHDKFDIFRSRYFVPAQKVSEHVRKYKENEDANPGPEYEPFAGAPQMIHEKIADITVELGEEEYGLLPKITVVPHMVQLPERLREHYKLLEKDAVLELMENTVIAQNGGVKTGMCWQLANGAVYNPTVDGAGRRTWQVMHDAMLDELDDTIEMLDQNVLIPYHFKSDLARILERRPGAVVLPRKAERVVEQWNEGRIRELLIHPKSGSHGLNIQYGGNQIIWLGSGWSNEQWMQTNRRLARPGQPAGTGVFAHLIMCAKTVHELQFETVSSNANDQHNFRMALRKYQRAMQMGVYTHELT